VDSPSLHFLAWDRPLLPQAVEWLARDWNGEGPLDLSRLLVVVPTSQSGRRLREALAERAAMRGQAALPPRVMTPEGLIAPSPLAATRLQSLLAWAEVFRGLETAEFREVFPIDPPSRNFSWALRLAEEFSRLQSELAEAGLRIADVAKAAGDFPETARWLQLADLERRHAGALGIRGLQDAKISAAEDPAPVAEEKIIVLAVPDPLPLALKALVAHARRIPVVIAVFAPETDRETFDEWGRPRMSAWQRREFPLGEFEGRVSLGVDPADQADRITALVRGYAALPGGRDSPAGDVAMPSGRLGSPPGRLAIGVADPEVLPLLEIALVRADFPVFNPEGTPRRRDSLYPLLEALAALAKESSFEVVATLARCPDFIEFLAARQEGGFSAARWLGGLDELRSRHLPADLAAAQRQAAKIVSASELEPGLAAIAEIRSKLNAGSFASGAASAMEAIFAGRRLDLAVASQARLADSSAAWRDVVEECGNVPASLPGAEWWELALRLFGDLSRSEEKPDGAVELQGWLELLYEDAPHLAVAGFNDGCVPQAVAGDPFLPEALREKLGLKTNGARLARDSYVLTALEACRRNGGRLDLLVGRVSEVGDPLRPSRLLLQCPDAELPDRVRFLFRDVEAGRVGPSWRRAWRLKPPEAPRFERIPATAFREYLECPFRFFLKRALHLSLFDPHKSELDAPDFGTLCHTALEAMAKEPAVKDSSDPAELRAFLHRALDREIRSRYGPELTLPLLIQVESARQRLARAAEVQAEQRRQGWVIEQAEKAFSLQVGRIRVSGKMDRVERNEVTGRRRVLDYKTADQPESPEDAHSRRAGRDPAPAFARFDAGGRERVWTNLQLPLYLEAVSREIGPAEAGYFNLPKAAGDTAVCVWDGYDESWRAAARRCAEGVAAAIADGVFWPPAELAGREDPVFEGWFHHGTAASVESPIADRKGDAP
jgi:ATP-dependent helicase/nuclease subunit B